MKVVAVDYGSARTGVAASDPTGTLARPVGVVERVRTAAGLQQLVELIRGENPEQVVVGMPLTLRGERGEQARETEEFVDTLRQALEVPVDGFDERFTTERPSRAALSGSGPRGPSSCGAGWLRSASSWPR